MDVVYVVNYRLLPERDKATSRERREEEFQHSRHTDQQPVEPTTPRGEMLAVKFDRRNSGPTSTPMTGVDSTAAAADERRRTGVDSTAAAAGGRGWAHGTCRPYVANAITATKRKPRAASKGKAKAGKANAGSTARNVRKRRVRKPARVIAKEYARILENVLNGSEMAKFVEASRGNGR